MGGFKSAWSGYVLIALIGMGCQERRVFSDQLEQRATCSLVHEGCQYFLMLGYGSF